MSTPTVLYLQALALVGLDRSDEAMRERDWETHFFDVRVRFFALNTFSLLVTAYTAHINIAGNEQIRPAPFLVLAALNSLGILSENRRLHAALACTALAIMLTQVVVPIVTTIG